MIRVSLPKLEIAVSTVEMLRAELQGAAAPRREDHPESMTHSGRRELWNVGRHFIVSRCRQLLTDGASPQPLQPSCDEYDVVTRNGLGRGTQPRIYLRGQMLPWRLSLSHTDRMLALGISHERHSRVGVDLVDPAELNSGALQMWCTPRERTAIENLGLEAFARIWGMKEALYKAVNYGEPFCPLNFEIDVESNPVSCRWRGVPLPLDIAWTRHLPEGGYVAAVAISDFPRCLRARLTHSNSTYSVCN